jgi:EAL domain-containing protein (putative c-di-GMP-specific phosphodiesterase class I)
MTEDATTSAIVRSTIELGHSLGLKVVAEGVEDEAGFRFLRQLGCDQAQGYFMSPPLPARELETWLRESKWSAVPRHAAPEARSASSGVQILASG